MRVANLMTNTLIGNVDVLVEDGINKDDCIVIDSEKGEFL